MANLSIYINDEPIHLSQSVGTPTLAPVTFHAFPTERLHVVDKLVNAKAGLFIVLSEALHVVDQLIVAPPTTGTAVVTRTRVSAHLETIRVDWVSDANGNVNGHWIPVGAGALWQIEFAPNLGATQPTNLFDVVVSDLVGGDLAVGKGANLVNTGGTLVAQNGPLSITPHGLIDVQVTNAGNAKTGSVILTIGRI